MFGISIDRPAKLFLDNEVVYVNSMFDSSQIMRNHQSISFQSVCEFVAEDILIPHKVNTNYTLADLLTKSLSEAKSITLRSRIMYSDNNNI